MLKAGKSQQRYQLIYCKKSLMNRAKRRPESGVRN